MVQFDSAKIESRDGVYILTVSYSYWGWFPYTEKYIYKSLELCQHKLLNIRCRNNLTVIDDSGNEKNLEVMSTINNK